MSEPPAAGHGSPFEAQRKMHELLAQETRHHIIQTILGHPTHLASLSELAYYTQKSESALLNQLGILEEHDIVTVYTHRESEGSRDLPSKFYGLTEKGIRVLDEFKYLRGVPILRAIHENTVKPPWVQWHEAAPRPDLPARVANAPRFDEDIGDVESGYFDEKPSIFADQATGEEAGMFDPLFDE